MAARPGSPERNGWDGAVLCGGASRRMGRDKSLIEIDGVPMARRVHDALREAGATTVAAVGGDEAGLRSAGIATRVDRWPGEGPLAGVITALRTVGEESTVVVLPCDLLRPDPGLVATIAAQRIATDADVVVPVAEGRPQWVHAAWKRRVVGLLEDVFSSGERSVVGSVRGLVTEMVEVDEAWRTADADRPSDL